MISRNRHQHFAYAALAHNLLEIEQKPPQFFYATDGTLLAYYAFLPAHPRAIIIFYHGAGSWSAPVYQNMAQSLMEDYDIGVYLMDVRGHGNSSGSRGDAPNPESVWDDIDRAITLVKEKHPQAKIFLAGHSAGAGLILNHATWQHNQDLTYEKKKTNINGYLLLAPFLGMNAGVMRTITSHENRFIARVRSLILAAYALSGYRFFAHTPAVFFNYPARVRERDQHILDYNTCAMACAVSLVNPRNTFALLKRPFALFIGEEDELFLPDNVIQYKHYAKQVYDQSIAAIIPKETHISIIYDAPRLFADAVNQWLKSC